MGCKKNKKETINDLQNAKQEAKENIRELSDEELSKTVSAGWCNPDAGGDERRDMNEEKADVAGLMGDYDGFAE